ncbi:CAP domain-containing protein [Clostridium bornimense]|nr:CAP domain-containing protein [Clostridium bornimense]
MKKIITTVLFALSISIIVSVSLGILSGITYFSEEEIAVEPIESKQDIVALLVEEYNENSKFYNKKDIEEKNDNEIEETNINTAEDKSDIQKESNTADSDEEKKDSNENVQAVIAEANNKASNENENVNTPTVTVEENTVTEVSQEPISNNFFANIEGIILQRVNEERAKEGLTALTYSSTMRKYARIKSMDMGERGYFEHRDPEGRLMSDIIKKDGIKYKAWGENIAYIGGMTDETAIAERFVNNWMNSSSHRANILCDRFSEIGIGVYKIGNRFYATQEFFN